MDKALWGALAMTEGVSRTGLKAVDGSILGIARFVAWFFGPAAPWAHVFYGLMALGWGSLMVAKPALFDVGSLAMLQWLPDPVWICALFVLVALHGVGLVRPSRGGARVVACLGSAWLWLFVTGSVAQAGVGTAVVAYGLMGTLALLVALQVAWSGQR